MEISDAAASTSDEVEYQISVVAAGHPMADQGELFQELCVALQGRAILYLLGEMDTNRYRWNLGWSVNARLFYLRKLREQQGVDTVFTALSRTDSVFAAIATGDLASPAELRRLSPAQWTPNGEYEHDFCYFAAVHAIVEGSDDDARQLLAQMLVALDDQADCRLDLCTSFLDRREVDFWRAFSEFTEACYERSAFDHDDGRLVGEPWLVAFQHVSLEAVSWMKLALDRGFVSPEPEYRMCPSIAVHLPDAPSAPDIFAQLEARFGL